MNYACGDGRIVNLLLFRFDHGIRHYVVLPYKEPTTRNTEVAKSIIRDKKGPMQAGDDDDLVSICLTADYYRSELRFVRIEIPVCEYN